MKNFLYFILMFVLLAAFGVGCSRGGGDAELVAIDSLIAVSPDSALAALGRIDTAALGEGGRAYHALLTMQARFLVGHSATDSADICRAWRWYAHHGPAGRQLRAMRYRATVAEEMGDPETAMRWYKRTELAASRATTRPPHMRSCRWVRSINAISKTRMPPTSTGNVWKCYPKPTLPPGSSSTCSWPSSIA